MTTTKTPVPAVSAATLEVQASPVKPPKPADKHGWWWGTGRRKAAVARVRLRPASAGKAGVLVTSARSPDRFRDVNAYFAEERDRKEAISPLVLTDLVNRFEVVAVCHGGGYMGQAGAMKLALARALAGYDPTLEPRLREASMLTRDARKVERKKYGRPGARRRFQFSKR